VTCIKSPIIAVGKVYQIGFWSRSQIQLKTSSFINRVAKFRYNYSHLLMLNKIILTERKSKVDNIVKINDYNVCEEPNVYRQQEPCSRRETERSRVNFHM